MKGIRRLWHHPHAPTPPILLTEKALPPIPPNISDPNPLVAPTDEGWTAVNLRPDIRLPAEIWKIVFQYATNTYPRPLTPNISSPRISLSEPCIPDPADERRLIRASMQVKLAISLVCRAWRAISYEFLFHTIHVTSQRTIPSLWYALREQPGGSDGPGALTWWIRRIWVEDLGPLSWFILASEKLPEYSVLELVKRCPRLVEFSGPGLHKSLKKMEFSPFVTAMHAIGDSALAKDMNSSSSGEEDEAVQPRVNTSPGLSFSFEIADADELNRFASANPTLTIGFNVLSALYLYSGSTPGKPATDTIPVHLPSLRFLSVQGQRAIEQAYTMVLPSLTTLQYIQVRQTDPLETLLIAHGMSLVELDLVGPTTAFAQGYLERTCPNLHTLHIFALSHFESVPSSHIYHSALHTLGVSQTYLGDTATRAQMAALMQRVVWAFPVLRVMRETNWRETALRQRAAVSGRLQDRRYCGYWMCLGDVVRNAGGVRLVDWAGRDVLGFHLPERCWGEWDAVLEKMLVEGMEVEEPVPEDD